MFRQVLTVSLLLISFSSFANLRELVDEMCIAHSAYDCDLVHAIVWGESQYTNEIVEDKGSLSWGPAQIKCGTAKLKDLRHSLKYGCEQLRNPRVSLRFAIYYINYQIERFEGDTWMAISAYNAGTPEICKNYNPGKCYPGEVYNYDYTDKVWRRHQWLRNERQNTMQISYPRFKKQDGLEMYPTSSKLDSQTILELTGVYSSESS